MYIVAVGWIYVVLMMAITEHTVVAGTATFVFYGMAPVALLLYIMGTPGRRRRRKAAEAAEAAEAAKARPAAPREEAASATDGARGPAAD